MKRRITRGQLLGAKVALTIAFPFILMWCAARGAAKEAWFEIRATTGEYLAAMRRDSL